MNAFLSAFSPIRNLRLLLVPPQSNYGVVDGLRALSMMMILVFHSFTMYGGLNPNVELTELVELGGWSWAWMLNSDKSVDTFFAISGFLITGILINQVRKGGVRFGNFYLRRFLRLSPAYYLVILLYLAFNGPNVENLWANALYVNNFIPYDKQAMNWGWSLAIEEQFYLIFPVLFGLVIMKSGRPLAWMWGLWIAAPLIRLIVILSDESIRTSPLSRIIEDPQFHAHHFSVIYDNLYTRYSAILSGCMAAYYHFYYPEQTKAFFASTWGRFLAVFSVLIVVLFMVFPIVSQEYDDYQWLHIVYQVTCRNLYGGAMAVWVLVSLESGLISKLLNVLFGNRFWHPFAQLSYSMYLVHVLAIAVVVATVNGFLERHPEVVWGHFETIGWIFLLSSLLTIFISLLIYLFVERPVMNLRK
jgi:peptidoglycan/LPS O-acetylase OafA/YrhL